MFNPTTFAGDPSIPPEGYMTADDFREKTTEDLKQLCIKHGILQ